MRRKMLRKIGKIFEKYPGKAKRENNKSKSVDEKGRQSTEEEDK